MLEEKTSRLVYARMGRIIARGRIYGVSTSVLLSRLGRLSIFVSRVQSDVDSRCEFSMS